MKFWINAFGWSTALCLILVVASGCFRMKSKYRTPRVELHFEEEDSDWSGIWRTSETMSVSQFEKADFWTQISILDGKNFIYSSSIKNRDFIRLSSQEQNDPRKIEFKTEAGSITFIPGNQEAIQEGLFEIEPNDAFRDLAESISGSPLTPQNTSIAILQETELETLRVYQVSGIDLQGDHLWAWIRFKISPENVVLLKKHLPNITAEDVIQLKRNGVPSEMIVKLAEHYPNYDANDYVTIRRSGVKAKYALEAAKSSYDFKPDELVNLRRHGVPAEWAAVCDRLAIVKGTDDMVLMRRHGVSLSYLKAVKGSPNVHSVEDIVTLRRHGISSDFLNELEESSLRLDVEQVIQLRNAGVRADYLKAIHAAGGYQVDDIILLRRHGVSEDLVRAANPPGKEPMTVNAIIELRNRGVSAKTIAELRK